MSSRELDLEDLLLTENGQNVTNAAVQTTVPDCPLRPEDCLCRTGSVVSESTTKANSALAEKASTLVEHAANSGNAHASRSRRGTASTSTSNHGRIGSIQHATSTTSTTITSPIPIPIPITSPIPIPITSPIPIPNASPTIVKSSTQPPLSYPQPPPPPLSFPQRQSVHIPPTAVSSSLPVSPSANHPDDPSTPVTIPSSTPPRRFAFFPQWTSRPSVFATPASWTSSSSSYFSHAHAPPKSASSSTSSTPNVVGKTPLPELSLSDIRQHCTRESCWLILHEQVVDVTSFLECHPAGMEMLLKRGGQDATQDYYFHSAHGRRLWRQMPVVGRVDADGVLQLRQQRAEQGGLHTYRPDPSQCCLQ